MRREDDVLKRLFLSAERDVTRMRKALTIISDGYGTQHISQFSRDVALLGLAEKPTPTPKEADQ